MYMSLAKNTNNKNIVKSMLNYSSLGLEMGLSVAIGIGIGYFLDSFFKTSPYLTIIFMFFRIAAAFKTIIVLIRKVSKEDERDHNK